MLTGRLYKIKKSGNAGENDSNTFALFFPLDVKFVNIFQEYTKYAETPRKIHVSSSLSDRFAIDHHQDTIGREIYNHLKVDKSYLNFKIDHTQCFTINCFFSLSS